MKKSFQHLLKILINLIFPVLCFGADFEKNNIRHFFSPPNVWTDQNNQVFDFKSINSAEYLGFVLSYTTCPTLCPMLSADLKRLNSKLRGQFNLKFVLISIDPENDTTTKLKKHLTNHRLDEHYFTFIKSDESITKKLSSYLNLNYDKSEQNSTHIPHSSIMVFFDIKMKKIGEINLSDGQVDNWVILIKKMLKRNDT